MPITIKVDLTPDQFDLMRRALKEAKVYIHQQIDNLEDEELQPGQKLQAVIDKQRQELMVILHGYEQLQRLLG
jgi:hypothetical protein